MNERTKPAREDNPTLQAIFSLLADHPDTSFTRREICSGVGRSKTSQMIRLIEMGVELGWWKALEGKWRNRVLYFYRIANSELFTEEYPSDENS